MPPAKPRFATRRGPFGREIVYDNLPNRGATLCPGGLFRRARCVFVRHTLPPNSRGPRCGTRAQARVRGVVNLSVVVALLVGVLLITYIPPLTTFLPHWFK